MSVDILTSAGHNIHVPPVEFMNSLRQRQTQTEENKSISIDMASKDALLLNGDAGRNKGSVTTGLLLAAAVGSMGSAQVRGESKHARTCTVADHKHDHIDERHRYHVHALQYGFNIGVINLPQNEIQKELHLVSISWRR